MVNKKNSTGPPIIDKRILYIGRDKAYWENLCTEIRKQYDRLEIEFTSLSLQNYRNYVHLFLEIFRNPVDIIYLDFTQDSEQLTKLSQIFYFEDTLNHIPLIGLVEKQEKIEESIFAGLSAIYIKSGEYEDIVAAPFLIAYQREANLPQYAKARFQKEDKLFADLRVGHITPDFLRAEGNIKLNEGDIIELHTHIPKFIIPSKKYRLKSLGEQNLYYNYRYTYIFEYIYVDEPVITDEEKEKLGEEQLNKINKEYQKNRQKARQELQAWIAEKKTVSSPKMTKALIISKDLSFLEDTKKDLDGFEHSIRIKTDFSENFYEIDKIYPHLIVIGLTSKSEIEEKIKSDFSKYQHDDGTPLSDEELREEKNKFKIEIQRAQEQEVVKKVASAVEKIKSMKDYKPYIVVFNLLTISSSQMQEAVKYPYIITFGGDFLFPYCMHMASAVEKKMRAKLSKKNDDDLAYFVPKKEKLSRAFVSFNVTIKEMTEYECTFALKEKLELAQFRSQFPAPITLKVIPFSDDLTHEKQDDQYLHRALIHSVGESEKKELRKFINQIFFSDLMARKEAEKAEWEKTQLEAKIQKRKDEAEAGED